jgi:hypothetical protein
LVTGDDVDGDGGARNTVVDVASASPQGASVQRKTLVPLAESAIT